ncbi:PAS domain-containing protein [Aureococcus anophagefferens]|nr:PAS domain-containing protein [Aureococcus anophagefferens]
MGMPGDLGLTGFVPSAWTDDMDFMCEGLRGQRRRSSSKSDDSDKSSGSAPTSARPSSASGTASTRGTRARKKEAIEKLKHGVEAWEVEARRTEERRAVKERKSERHERLLAEVFRARGEAVVDPEVWASWLAPGFELWQPQSDYVAHRPSDVVRERRVSRGVAGMADDVAAWAVFMHGVGRSGAFSSRMAEPPAYECRHIHADDKPLRRAFHGDPRAKVVTTARRPFVIANVNQAWLDLCGFGKDEVLGRTMSCIQGELTDRRAVESVHAAVAAGRAADMTLINYTSKGDAFLNYVRVFPLYADANPNQRPSNYLGILEDHAKRRHAKLDDGPTA